MKILIACEESQRVTTEFRKLGHEAYSCDLIATSGANPEWHIQGDALELLDGRCSFSTQDGTLHSIDSRWDMIIAFPPCTNLSSSGQWAYNRGKPISLREESVEFFMRFVNADCPRIAIENPVGIMSTRYRKPDQIIHTWQYGDNVEKNTCLWLKGLPLLKPECTVMPEMEYFECIDSKTGKKKRQNMWMYNIRKISNRQLRAKIASKTFEGIAKAMASQWGTIQLPNKDIF